jgi:uncharacterized surface protein with fasciclin (FAS1) repeats
MKFSFLLSAILATGGASGQTIVEVAVNGNFFTLVDLVVAADLADTLGSADGITVFAPVDDAFASLDPTLVSNLQTEPWKAHLQDLLAYHVLEDTVSSSDITNGLSVETLNGENITLKFSINGNVVVNDVSNVVQADIPAGNGIIHVSICNLNFGEIK